MEIYKIPFLGALLREYANIYEHPREKLIVLVHWVFIRRLFLILKHDENKDIMNWIKDENDSINIVYFRLDIVIHTEQYFDNENFYIQLKVNENNQLILEMSVNDYINENDGSLKNIDKFIQQIGNGIDEITRRKQEIIDNLRKEMILTKTTLIIERENGTQLKIITSVYR